MASRRYTFLALVLLLAFIISACNLSGAPSEEQIAQTSTAGVTSQPTRTPISTSGVPTTVPVTRPTNLPTFSFPTAIVSVPTRITQPTSVPPPTQPSSPQVPVSIAILSPVSGNVVAGNVQVLGSASHPQFLQYQVEFGPDPNPGNLWFPATNAITTPVLNGLLGIWNTNTVQDSRYQLRLRVYLRDGTLLTTVINNVTVQNRVNTPVPSPTPNIPRPIAAFTQDRTSGDAPLTVRFTNQSSGTINVISWNFGDGNTSAEVHPQHTYGAPGLYTVTLSITGPGGTSNVSRQINVTSPSAPVAGFTMNPAAGLAPLTVQFTDASTGNVTSYQWFFSDGSTSALRNPSHTFSTPGTYNVFLTVSGPGGSSSVTRQITVNTLVSPTFTPSLTFTPTFTPTETTTVVPPTATFTPTFTETPTNTTTVIPPTATFTPTFTETPTNTSVPPTSTETPTETTTVVPPTATFTETPTSTFVPPTATFTETPTNTFIPPTATFTETPTNTSIPPTETHTPTATNTEFPAPQAFFTAVGDPNNPLAVQFTNGSTGDIAQFAWDFGDGTTSNEPNPSHTYQVGGSYTVNLTVTDTLSRSSIYSSAVTVSEPVVAAFTPNASGLTVEFVNQSTGPVTAVAWDFGDGTASSEPNPSHAYSTGGTYNVTLAVSDANGRTSIVTLPVTVAAPIQAAFTPNAAGLAVQFTDQSTGPVTGYTWDFGDGTGSNEQSPSHTYAAGGTYNVTLTVSDAGGNTNSATLPVNVSEPVQAAFTPSVSGLSVQFTNQSTGPVTGYTWNFGDGSSSNEPNPAYAYSAGGTYDVTLTVSDAGGNTDSTTQQVAVAAPVQAAFTPAVTDLTVQFTDQSTGPVAGYTWDFGDGGASNEQNPSHAYTAEGSYTVTLTVSDASGGTNSISQPVTVAVPVEANFTAQPTDLSVQFTNQSTGQVAQYAWNFGDGNTSNEPNPLHTYAAPGSYPVTLVVTSNSGATDDQSQMVEVSAALEASFTAQPTDLTVQFTSQVTSPVTTYAWEFGDGSTSSEPNPAYTYAAGGNYTVRLVVTDAAGRTDEFSSDVAVTAPVVEPTTPPTSIVDTTPVLPNINQLRDVLRGIYANGVNSFGNRAGVFAVAGDSLFTVNGILSPFALGGQYELAGNDDLKPIIDWFNFADLGGTTSFNRTSLALNPNWRAQDLLDPAQANPVCNGEAPLPCELHQILPVLMFVSIGANDAQIGTDPAAFQNSLTQIVNTIVANGTIPVLMTIRDASQSPQVAAINEAIISVAQANNLPLINVARALAELPTDNLDTSPAGAGDLSADSQSNFGINAVNGALLRVLGDMRNIVFPDA